MAREALILDHGTEIPADLLWGIAPHWTPEVLRNTDLVDSSGYVEVDLHTMETGYSGVYAIGDAAAVQIAGDRGLCSQSGYFCSLSRRSCGTKYSSISSGVGAKTSLYR